MFDTRHTLAMLCAIQLVDQLDNKQRVCKFYIADSRFFGWTMISIQAQAEVRKRCLCRADGPLDDAG